MTALTTWLLGEPCPDCDALLALLDDGQVMSWGLK